MTSFDLPVTLSGSQLPSPVPSRERCQSPWEVTKQGIRVLLLFPDSLPYLPSGLRSPLKTIKTNKQTNKQIPTPHNSLVQSLFTVKLKPITLQTQLSSIPHETHHTSREEKEGNSRMSSLMSHLHPPQPFEGVWKKCTELSNHQWSEDSQVCNIKCYPVRGRRRAEKLSPFHQCAYSAFTSWHSFNHPPHCLLPSCPYHLQCPQSPKWANQESYQTKPLYHKLGLMWPRTWDLFSGKDIK